jgi:hypothetical protein
MYFPKSQIKPNLYTNGGEYILSTTKQDYIGYYYEVSSGQRFTGKTPQDGANILLISPNKSQLKTFTPTNPLENFPIELTNDESNLNYINIQSNPPNIRALPQPNPTFPTQSEQDLGVYTRYFCKKNNELKYMEIDKTTFEKLNTKSKNIAWDLYTPISTLWYLRKNIDSYGANKGLISLIEKNQKWYGFTQWFKDKF